MSPQKAINTPSSLPRSWSLLCLFNLLLTAALGLLMRYKIVFPFRALNQGHALNAHENFVFAGWVGLTLFSCMVAFVLPKQKASRGIYRVAFYALEIFSLLMLPAFLIFGFNALSITVLFLAFASGVLFVTQLWKDLGSAEVAVGTRLFLRGGMLWHLLSIPGVIAMIYIARSGHGTAIQVRSFLYYFLHFQYNGWFTFAIFGLLLNWLDYFRNPLRVKTIKIIFWLLTAGLIPGYFLSILAFYPRIWAEIPSVISVVFYFTAALLLFRIIYKLYPRINIRTPTATNLLWKIATLSFFLKTFMQAATLIPSMAKFAFSFRPLIIGFLHLTFLCFVSFFLIGYLLFHGEYRATKNVSGIGLILFATAVIGSEIAIFTQAFFAYILIYPPLFNKLLFWITVAIFLGMLLFMAGNLRRKKPEPPAYGTS